jgi:hypothetical protein
MKNCILILLFLNISLQINGQEILLKKDPAIDSTIEKKGPNRKHFWHPFMSFGFAVDAGEKGATVVQPNLDQFALGLRYKRRINNIFSVGFEFSYTNYAFSIKQNKQKTTPDTSVNQKQRFYYYDLQLSPYFRVNFGKRGNVLGNYFDIAPYYEAVIALTEFTKYKLPDGSVVRARRSGVNYFQRINYGIQARIGLKKIIFFGQYRISNAFYGDKNLAEIPRITAGVQFVLR